MSTMASLDSQNHCSALLSSCIKAKNLNLGRSLHSYLIKTALVLDAFLANRLIHLYSKCSAIACAQTAFDDLPFKNAHSWNAMIYAYSKMGKFTDACQLLDEMPEPNLVSFNAIISCLGRSGLYADAINAFRRMRKWGGNAVLMDEFTVVGLANAAGNLAALQALRQVHGTAITVGLDFNVVVCNALIDAYGKCGAPESSFAVFRRMGERDVISWTSVVVSYARASKLEDACRVFDAMPVRNVVSWTAVITGLVRNGEGERAISYFMEMQDEGVVANDVTYVGVLSACADLALIGKGKQVHCHVVRVRRGDVYDNVFIVNALIDMYGKCGYMENAMRLFDRLEMRDTVTWNSIITGFAQSGLGDTSLAVFKRMLQAGVNPNGVTFIGVLSACSHAGLESEGLKFFNMMEKNFGLIPQINHYAILVDLLGRKNRLMDAMELIKKAPDGSGHVGMWGALLAASRVHGSLGLGVKAAEALIDLEPENTGRYVMLSNIYATAGKWEDARQIRMLVDNKDLKKEAGSSWIEVKNVRCVFVAEQVEQSDIQEVLLSMVNQMKEFGDSHLENLSIFS